MEAEVGVAVHGGEDGDPDLALADRRLDLVEEPVAGLHALAVQERPEAQPAAEVVVEQPRHVPLRVDPPVVDEHVARRLLPPAPQDLAAVAPDGADDGGGGGALHGGI